MFAAISANNGRQENSKISRIVRLGDPSIGFLKNNTKKKNISAAEKPFKTLAIFSSFGKDLKRGKLHIGKNIVKLSVFNML